MFASSPRLFTFTFTVAVLKIYTTALQYIFKVCFDCFYSVSSVCELATREEEKTEKGEREKRKKAE